MTQEQTIQNVLDFNQPKSIKEIQKETNIREPSIRRILGQGTKNGKFSRIDRGVYILSINGEDRAYVHTADAIETLPKLADEGLKADMIFLDIPYNTPAVKGGNRGIKYQYIEPPDFYKIASSLKRICRNEDTPLIYMYSKAQSGQRKMKQYTEALLLNGFKVVAEGDYFKYQLDGVTRVRNMRGDIIEPEGILILNQSGRYKELNLQFHCIRPKGYQTEKSGKMIGSLIEQTTKENDTVLDPFAGSGVVLSESIRRNRKAIGIEINPNVVQQYIYRRVA
jgi:DNA modification methylase